MSYTGTEIFNMAIAVIDELSDAGTVSEAQVRAYKARAPYLLDMWQRENPGIYKTVSIARHLVKNLLGEQFDTVEHISEDKTYETQAAAKSAVFYVTDAADIYIEEYSGGSWVSLSGYYSKDGGDETAFAGLISVPALSSPSKFKCRFTSSGVTRLRFSGSYYYLFYNFALFEAAFPTCAKVPEYAEFVKYDMPENFDGITEITEESPQSGLSHKWENDHDLYVNYDFDGILKVTYKASPAKITSLTQAVEVDNAIATTGAYYLAMHFALADMNSELTALCKSKYESLKALTTKKRVLTPVSIQDVYSISSIR